MAASLVLPSRPSLRIGVLSDTHGVLPAGIAGRFSGVDAILHAGDIGEPEVLETLQAIAPLLAVRGNMDVGPWARSLPRQAVLEAGPVCILVVHDRMDLRRGEPSPARVVVSGHTHRPEIAEENGVLYLNPGSAGFPRRGEPPTLGLIRIHDGDAEAELIYLPD
mgnify:FL=1